MQVKKQQLELDMKQQTGSKLGKEYVKVVYCHTAHLTYMQSTSCEMPGWMKCKLESRLLEDISITSDMQMTPPLWQKAKRNFTHLLSVALLANIFAHSQGGLFVLFTVSFAVQKLLSLIRSHLFTFVFILIFITLGGGSKKLLLQIMSEYSAYVFL